MGRRRRFLLSTAAIDVVALCAAVLIASWMLPDFGTPFPWRIEPNVWPMLGSLLVGSVVGSYVSARAWAQGAPRPSYGRAATIAAVSLAFTAFVVLLSRVYWSRPLLAATGATWLGLMLAHRFARRLRPWTESFVLVSGEKGLIDDLQAAPHVDVVDVLSPDAEPPSQPYGEDVVLAVDLRAVLSDGMARYISSSHLAGSAIRPMTSVYEEHTGRLPIVHLVEGWELTVPLSTAGFYLRAKRALDTMLILITAVVWIPLGLIAAVAIKADSRGPVIFRQERIGRFGRPFTMYKFRTMAAGAEEGGARFASPDDDRNTRVGGWLRRFRADELPQLWNVLKGDLSLVGPRPEQAGFVETFTATIPFYSHRHLVRPGITGWAQVNFGYADDAADTIEKLTYDLYYIKNVSPWLDVAVFLKSFWIVLSGFGAR